MKKYCECIIEKGSSNKECVALGEDIILKYEYDQEAAAYIEEEINKCTGNK